MRKVSMIYRSIADFRCAICILVTALALGLACVLSIADSDAQDDSGDSLEATDGCIESSQPEDSPEMLIDEIDLTGSPTMGPEDAAMTVVEFSDYECFFCAKSAPTIKQLVQAYPEHVRWIFKNYPLSFHQNAPLAHEAALAAGEQGKFWEMHDILFSNQKALERTDLTRYAKQLDLDLERFQDALDSRKFLPIVERDKAEGALLGVMGTPTFFINGIKVKTSQAITVFKKLIERKAADSKRQTEQETKGGSAEDHGKAQN